MEFSVMARTYNTYGGDLTLSLIPDFLLGNADDFGSAVTELTVIFHFPQTGEARRTLEKMFADFHANRESLPTVAFRRKRGEATIDIASDLLDGRDWDQKRGLSLPLFRSGVVETVAALSLLRSRLTERDDFRLDELLAHCDEARSRMPSTPIELADFAEECERKRKARYEAMSPWDRLEIEWRDFHPEARIVLDDPFFWEGVNDFAPHGNDTGADLLEDYRKWIRRHPTDDPVTFYRKLISRWGCPPEPSSELDHTTMDEAAVALAFAELKLRAHCRTSVAVLARAAIERQRQRANEAVDWPHKEERLKALVMLESKLPRVDA